MRYRSPSAEDEDNISDILKNPARICEMDIEITSSLLERCTPFLEESFPALEYLRLKSQETMGANLRGELVLPDHFLGSSTPRLSVVRLHDTNFPTLPRLLSSSKNLVSLQLEKIPPQGIFTAQDLAVGLSPATKLESLKIEIYGYSYPPRPPRLNELPPLPTRAVLPALLEFDYVGESSYLGDFASRIDAPIIEKIGATFICDFEGHNTHELCGFFARGEELRSSRRRTTHIRFFDEFIIFTHHFFLSPSLPGSFRVRLLDHSLLDELVALMTQICLGFKSWGILHKVTRFEIEAFPETSRWYRELDPADWLTFFRALTDVKRLRVVGTLVSSVVFALAQVTGEATCEILPNLRHLHLPGGPGASALTSASIGPFIAARELYGLPVVVHYKGLDWHDDCSDE